MEKDCHPDSLGTLWKVPGIGTFLKAENHSARTRAPNTVNAQPVEENRSQERAVREQPGTTAAW